LLYAVWVNSIECNLLNLYEKVVLCGCVKIIASLNGVRDYGSGNVFPWMFIALVGTYALIRS